MNGCGECGRRTGGEDAWLRKSRGRKKGRRGKSGSLAERLPGYDRPRSGQIQYGELILGSSYRCVLAIKGYPPTTEDLAPSIASVR